MLHPDIRLAISEANRELRRAISEPGHSIVEDRLIGCLLNLMDAIEIYHKIESNKENNA